PGERCQLTRVRALIQREQDDAEDVVIPQLVEERMQIARPLRSDRDIRSYVRSELPKQGPVVVTERSGMELHHHPILSRHPAHLDEHVALEEALIGGGSFAP